MDRLAAVNNTHSLKTSLAEGLLKSSQKNIGFVYDICR